MDYTRYQRIRFDRRDRVLTLTLHRPDKPASLNAVDEPMHRELSQVFYDVALDDEADVLVITGDGTAFSSGGDIEWMSRTTEASATEGKKLLQGLLDLEKPTRSTTPGSPTRMCASAWSPATAARSSGRR
jgi:enoyl-CoA hydratase